MFDRAALAPENEATFQVGRPFSRFLRRSSISSQKSRFNWTSTFFWKVWRVHLESRHLDQEWTYEHLKVLDDTDTFHVLLSACNNLAQARVPGEIAQALMSARLTALTLTDGGVTGIATGCSLRRLVARTMAKQFIKVFEAECSPSQYALSTRAGTDCVGHLLRAATDARPTATILSVEDRGVRPRTQGHNVESSALDARSQGNPSGCSSVARPAIELCVV